MLSRECVRALRGATCVDRDDAASITRGVEELLGEMIARNELASGDVISAIFSATPDLRSLYPAAVARRLGWNEVPMLCVTEMPVDGAPARCIRVLLHLAVARLKPLRPVYLGNARALRPDLLARHAEQDRADRA